MRINAVWHNLIAAVMCGCWHLFVEVAIHLSWKLSHSFEYFWRHYGLYFWQNQAAHRESYAPISLTTEDGSRFSEPVRVPGVPGAFERAYVLQKIKGNPKMQSYRYKCFTEYLNRSRAVTECNMCVISFTGFSFNLFRWRENSKLHWRGLARDINTERRGHWKDLAQFASMHQNISSLDCPRQDNWSKKVCIKVVLFLKVLQWDAFVSVKLESCF